MLDQEIASIMRFVLATAGNPMPIYNEMPQDFCVPAIYFPPPEITGGGDTFLTYSAEYTWFIKAFHVRNDLANDIVRAVALSLMAERRLIPMYNVDGSPASKLLRLDDPETKPIDAAGVGGAAQLTIRWTSRRPYNANEAEKMMGFHLDINEAYQSAVRGAQTAHSGPKN